MATNQAAARSPGAGPAGAETAGVELGAHPLPPCPWCGGGTELEVRGDGLGQMAMRCAGCGAAGPQVPLAGDLGEADRRAIALWSGRRQARPVGRETVNRVGLAVRMHCLTGRLTPEATIGVAWSDLDALLRSITMTEAPPAG